MKTADQYEQMTKVAAFHVMKAFSIFEGEPEHIISQSRQYIMQRVNRMIDGDQSVIDGDKMITEIKDAGQQDPINTHAGTEPQ
jgi:hypothetical protein